MPLLGFTSLSGRPTEPFDDTEALNMEKETVSKRSSGALDDDAVPNILYNNDSFDDDSKVPYFTPRLFAMTVLVSMGGLCFGCDTGQISGFLEMDSFHYQFGDLRDQTPPGLSTLRTGLLVAMLSIGILIGALIAGPLANNKVLGKKYSISMWCTIFVIGNCFKIAARYSYWWIMMMGRIISGFAIGGLSVMVPAYQGESAPTHVRGTIVSCYQLFITSGILIAQLVNFGTERIEGDASWRIPVGLSFVFAVILGVGILFFPETPRHKFRHGAVDSAANSIAKFHGVSIRHKIVRKQMVEMQEKLRIEQEGGKHSFMELFTGPRMLYRVVLGMTIQALQQMTGANFFLYYGVTIFSAVGLDNSFATQIILGSVNVICTFPGLYMVEKFGRRKCLTLGAAWMFIGYMIFASLGYFALETGEVDAQGEPINDPVIGNVMIVFSALFFAAFASTWGPMAWAVTSEIYQSRYRSSCIALSAASNWGFNFFLGFATPFIEAEIGFSYGYVFAECNLLAVFVVYFFLSETSGRSLEECDTMFLLEIKPWQSSKCVAPQGEDLLSADKLRLTNGGREIRKMEESRKEDVQYDNLTGARANSTNAEASGVRRNSLA